MIGLGLTKVFKKEYQAKERNHHHQLKLHDRTRIEQCLEEKKVASLYEQTPQKLLIPPKLQK